MRKLVVLLILVFALLGCSQVTRDLEGVDVSDPYAVQVWANADLFPNLEYICLDEDGPTYLITTREYHQPQVVSETCVIEPQGQRQE